jgi:hypothetical protein
MWSSSESIEGVMGPAGGLYLVILGTSLREGASFLISSAESVSTGGYAGSRNQVLVHAS